MCAKLTFGWSGLLCIALGIGSAGGGVPPGLRQALGEFETGATRPTTCAGDFMVGSRKEISRFQILPTVWRAYSSSGDYRNPQTSWRVASKILADREQAFRQATKREWDYVDIYLMWNAPGLYQRAKWDRRKISRVVLKRAERFANLMEERSRVYASQAVARN